MIKVGVLEKRYKGIVDCFSRVGRGEGISAFW
jgi:hypothetical protein